jgi:hypothetical protein
MKVSGCDLDRACVRREVMRRGGLVKLADDLPEKIRLRSRSLRTVSNLAPNSAEMPCGTSHWDAITI